MKIKFVKVRWSDFALNCCSWKLIWIIVLSITLLSGQMFRLSPFVDLLKEANSIFGSALVKGSDEPPGLKRNCNRVLDGWTKESGPRHPDVMLVGQFSYNTDVEYVLHFVRRWKDFFGYVQVRGPFNASNIAQLHKRGVDVFWGDDDAGWFSPMKNLANALEGAMNNSMICGVLLAHDDLIFNVTHLETLGFPSTTGILSQVYPDVASNPYLQFTNDSNSFRRVGDSNSLDTSFESWPTLRPWRWWKHCVKSFANAVAIDPRGHVFADSDGAVHMYANSVGDFMYIPNSLAEPLVRMATWLYDNHVFLECGMPTLVGHLKHNHNATATFVHYCTDWTKERNNYRQWIPVCAQGGGATNYFPHPLRPEAPYGLYHPVKLSLFGTEVWDSFFDLINPTT